MKNIYIVICFKHSKKKKNSFRYSNLIFSHLIVSLWHHRRLRNDLVVFIFGDKCFRQATLDILTQYPRWSHKGERWSCSRTCSFSRHIWVTLTVQWWIPTANFFTSHCVPNIDLQVYKNIGQTWSVRVCQKILAVNYGSPQKCVCKQFMT